MRQYFNFDLLLEKYKSTFTLVTEGNGFYNDAGDFIKPNITTVEKQGAIIGIKDYKIFRSAGVLTAQDKELFMTEPLGDICDAYVLFEGNKYKIESITANNNEFTGIWSYILKLVKSKFIDLNENLMNNATYGSGYVIQSSAGAETLGRANTAYGIFVVPITPNKTYLVKKTEDLGSLFRVGFIEREPTASLSVYNLASNKENKEMILTAPEGCINLIIQGHANNTDGDIHTELKKVLQVIEVQE